MEREQQIRVQLDHFDGPLALLLHLIQREEYSIEELDLNTITKQYLIYLNKMNELDFDVAGEYLYMASTLLFLKSKYCVDEEDAKRGDKTLSIKLGIKGTFLFTAVFFVMASVLYFFYFDTYHQTKYGWTFIIAMIPLVLFFIGWFLAVLKIEDKANYKNTMWLNFISATCLGGFFLYFFLNSTN